MQTAELIHTCDVLLPVAVDCLGGTFETRIGGVGALLLVPALGAVRARRGPLGRPTTVSREAVAITRVMRASGASLREVARALNDEGVPTAQGGRQWYASTVRTIEQSARDS